MSCKHRLCRHCNCHTGLSFPIPELAGHKGCQNSIPCQSPFSRNPGKDDRGATSPAKEGWLAAPCAASPEAKPATDGNNTRSSTWGGGPCLRTAVPLHRVCGCLATRGRGSPSTASPLLWRCRSSSLPGFCLTRHLLATRKMSLVEPPQGGGSPKWEKTLQRCAPMWNWE